MGQVYSRAESVVAWLGQPTKNTDHVMDHISRLKDLDLVYPDAAGLGKIEQAFAAIRDSATFFPPELVVPTLDGSRGEPGSHRRLHVWLKNSHFSRFGLLVWQGLFWDGPWRTVVDRV